LISGVTAWEGKEEWQKVRAKGWKYGKESE